MLGYNIQLKYPIFYAFFFFKQNSFLLVKRIVMHLQDVDPEAFFWVGGWVGVAIRWSPVLWLNLQMAGRREMRWYVFLFFFESETTGEKFSTFPKKRGWWRDDDWNWGCYDETQVFFGGDFLEKQISSYIFIKRWSSWSCSRCFCDILWFCWWLEVVFFLNIVCEVQNEEDETLLDPYMIPKDFGIFEVIESSDSTTDAWIFTNPVELDGTFHFEREVSSRTRHNCSLQFLWDASWYYQRRPWCAEDVLFFWWFFLLL